MKASWKLFKFVENPYEVEEVHNKDKPDFSGVSKSILA